MGFFGGLGFFWVFFLYLTLTWSKPEPEVFVNVPILLSFRETFLLLSLFGFCLFLFVSTYKYTTSDRSS